MLSLGHHFGNRRYRFCLLVLSLLLVGSTARAAEDNTGPIYLDEPEADPPPIRVQGHKLEDKYSNDDQVRVEREVILMSNNRLMNHGLYTEYYRDGQKFAEGSYDRGIHEGKWNYWYPNGQLCKTVNFKKGLPDGSWERFREDGTLFSSISYSNGQREGKWTYYYDDGKTIKAEENYKQGKMDGVRTAYYENGQKKQEAHLKMGILDGMTTNWDESGNKVKEAPFVNGKLNGAVVTWTGGVASELHFREGQRVVANEDEDLVPLEKDEDEL